MTRIYHPLQQLSPAYGGVSRMRYQISGVLLHGERSAPGKSL